MPNLTPDQPDSEVLIALFVRVLSHESYYVRLVDDRLTVDVRVPLTYDELAAVKRVLPPSSIL